MAAINYLFPPDQIANLPTWRFVLHFLVTDDYHNGHRQKAIENLKSAEWKMISFLVSLDDLSLDESGEALSIPFEVSEENRSRRDSLADYESDVWKIIGNVTSEGFGDIYYEALDWKE